MFHFNFGHYTWPFFIIIPGLVLFCTSLAFERRPGINLAIFGAMLTTTGILLLIRLHLMFLQAGRMLGL